MAIKDSRTLYDAGYDLRMLIGYAKRGPELVRPPFLLDLSLLVVLRLDVADNSPAGRPAGVDPCLVGAG